MARKRLHPRGGTPAKGTQGELNTREDDRTIKVQAGKGKTSDHVVPQLVVELKADTVRIFDRSNANGEPSVPPSRRSRTESRNRGSRPSS